MRRGVLATLAVVLALAVSPLTPGRAAVVRTDDLNGQKSSVDQDIAELTETLSGTSKELSEAYGKYASSAAALRTARATLRSDRAAEARAKQKNAELATRLAAAQLAQKNAQQQLAKGQAAIRNTERRTGQFAAQVYRHNGISPQLELILGSSSPDDFSERSAMVDYVLQYQEGSLRSLQQQKAANLTVQDRVTSVQQQVSTLKSQAAEAYRDSRAASASAAAEAAKITKNYNAQKSAVASIRSRKGEEDTRMATLKKQQTALTRKLAQRAAEARTRSTNDGGGNGTDTIGPTGGIMTSPVPGAPVTSTFGWRMHPIYHTKRLHEGMDFGVACGVPVHAAADGDVIGAGVVSGYGNQIIVDHGFRNGQDVTTTYNHLTSFVVSSGHVTKGQVIAYSGTTGSSTGCHLHFEVRLNGAPVNPAPYL